MHVAENQTAETFRWEIQEDDGATVAAFKDERTAARVLVLLESSLSGSTIVDNDTKAGTRYSARRASTPAPTSAPRPNMYQDGGPRPGRIYDVLTGADVGSSSTPPTSTPPAADGPETGEAVSWPGPFSAEVQVWPSGFAYVRFDRVPPEDLRDELRGAGFRWMAKRRAWRGLVHMLPESFAQDASA